MPEGAESESLRGLASSEPGMVISGIVRDHDDPSRASGAGMVESFQEDKAGDAVELVRLALEKELAVAKYLRQARPRREQH